MVSVVVCVVALQLLILRVKIENEGNVGMETMIGVSEIVTPLKL